MPYCRGCQTRQPKDAFYPDVSRMLKVQSLCRACNNKRRKVRRFKTRVRQFLEDLEPYRQRA